MELELRGTDRTCITAYGQQLGSQSSDPLSHARRGLRLPEKLALRLSLGIGRQLSAVSTWHRRAWGAGWLSEIRVTQAVLAGTAAKSRRSSEAAQLRAGRPDGLSCPANGTRCCPVRLGEPTRVSKPQFVLDTGRRGPADQGPPIKIMLSEPQSATVDDQVGDGQHSRRVAWGGLASACIYSGYAATRLCQAAEPHRRLEAIRAPSA